MEPTAATKNEDVCKPERHERNRRFLITVEPVMFLYTVYIAGATPLLQQYIYERVAENHNTTSKDLSNSSECSNNYSDPDYILHHVVQHETSLWMIYLSAVQIPISCVTTVILGGYSDKGGRKLGMFLPILGAFAKMGLCIVISIFNLPKEVLFAAFLAESLSGSFACVLMATFSYISDITTHSDRAIKIVILETAIGMGLIVGQLMTGYLIEAVGFTYSFAILTVVLLISILYVKFVVIETRHVPHSTSLCTTDHFSHVLKVLCHNDQKDRRWKLLLAMVLLALSSMVEFGFRDSQLLYVLDPPMCWNSVKVSYN